MVSASETKSSSNLTYSKRLDRDILLAECFNFYTRNQKAEKDVTSCLNKNLQFPRWGNKGRFFIGLIEHYALREATDLVIQVCVEAPLGFSKNSPNCSYQEMAIQKWR